MRTPGVKGALRFLAFSGAVTGLLFGDGPSLSLASVLFVKRGWVAGGRKGLESHLQTLQGSVGGAESSPATCLPVPVVRGRAGGAPHCALSTVLEPLGSTVMAASSRPPERWPGLLLLRPMTPHTPHISPELVGASG